MELRTDKLMVCPDELNLQFKSMKIMSPKEVIWINGSMQEAGQKYPLRVVATSQGELVLLDGFKRHLSAAGMQWPEVEIKIIGDSIESGIATILRDSVDLHLHILEQSKFIGYMIDQERYTIKQMANLLGKSVGWVSNRKNFSIDCPQIIIEKIFDGLLPASSYAMTFRKFIQKYECSNDEITLLVKAVSGKSLSFKEVDQLVTAYFTLGQDIAESIIAGKISDVLRLLNPSHTIPMTMLESEVQNKFEMAILNLSSLLETIQRLKHQPEYTSLFKSIGSSLYKSLITKSSEVTKKIKELILEEKI